ncbi:DUF397 domain-containing protein [Actinomadura macrotermitis]|uniref:DUF397 domain-containing protein n=1 Tax=Actinomadura macrotermitis TaxID=2585200 RepID=A0A7K0BVP5_9ACTN|nr:DUF397 domain-containing protein [Actinomadura macrotermitis]MQY04754.1 hypothetical protein [Actinomadura macrotermitis]
MADFTAARWRKSSRSTGKEDCVEVAGLSPVVAVRDSQDPDGPKLTLDATAWRTFAHRIKIGELDLA